MFKNQERKSLLGVIASMAVVNLVYGISFPLLALVLDDQGVSKSLIGLNTVVQAAAIFAVAPLAPFLLKRWNPARVMQVSALLLALGFFAAGLYRNVWFWFPLRFVLGALTALLWITSETLINHLVKDQHRGRIVAIYSAVGSAGFAMGPLLLVLTGSDGMIPFYATCTMILISALPLWLVQRVSTDTNDHSESSGLWRVFRLGMVIMLANLVYAAAVESMITFFPLFGISLGLSESSALGLMTLIALGGMLLIIPLGWLSDRVDRMGFLAVCVALTATGFLFMPMVVQAGPWTAAVTLFIFGGVEGMIYALGVTLVGEQFRGNRLATATTAFTVCWGAGTILGPLIAGIGMDRLGDHWLPWIAGLFFLVYLPGPCMAWWRRRTTSFGP